ncbi:hypothetical protein [Ruminococcus flavefaciens]|uniref:hypothetical protein n=1 Tax=Ruminococcus flavefaciens TaxID=1265 RepID=UPI0026ED4F8A|nr:hypothetical protein [Ruminococcus flavefaciens]
MMDYKEMAEIVTREVDAILERKKIRAKRIKKVSLAVSGLCAAVIVGVGAWHFSSDIKKPDDGFKGSGIISETETTTANAVTTAKVTTVTADTTETKTTETTAKATTVITTSEVAKGTARMTSAVSAITVRTTASVTQQPQTTAKTTSANTSETVNTTSIQNVTTSTAATTLKIPSTFTPTTGDFSVGTTTYVLTTVLPTRTTTTQGDFSVITTIVSDKYSDFRDLFTTHTATVAVKNDILVYYEKQNVLIPPERIDTRNVYFEIINLYISDTEVQHPSMRVYEIIDINRDEAVAVRLFDTDEFYLFVAPDY